MKIKIKNFFKKLLAKKNVGLVVLLLLPWILTELLARGIFTWYRDFPKIDIISHFFAGLGFAGILFLIFKERVKFVFLFILILAISWEIGELIYDAFVPQPPWFIDCFFCRDGLTDITMNLSGFFVAALLFKKEK